MSDQQRAEWAQQSLIEGGYDRVVVTFTCHLSGNHDIAQVNALITDLPTGNWIACQVPVAFLDTRDQQHTSQYFIDFLEGVRRYLSPF